MILVPLLSEDGNCPLLSTFRAESQAGTAGTGAGRIEGMTLSGLLNEIWNTKPLLLAITLMLVVLLALPVAVLFVALRGTHDKRRE
jgi:hypothetical protein